MGTVWLKNDEKREEYTTSNEKKGRERSVLYPSRMEIANRTNLCERLSHKHSAVAARHRSRKKRVRLRMKKRHEMQQEIKGSKWGSWEGQKRRPVGWGI
jgi:hypothetical protein